MKIVSHVIAAAALALTVSVASAADLSRPVYKAQPMVAPAYNWSGFYLGAHGGYGFGNLNASGLIVGERDIDGFFGGGQVGYNWQAVGSPWVFGVEADASFGNIGDSISVAGVSFETEAKSFGTIRGRVGYAPDRILWYVTGGAAWVNNEVTLGAAGVGSVSSSNTHWGWTVGAGVEWAMLDAWTAKVEYLYINTESQNYFAGILGPVLGFDPDIHTFRFGLNYRFGGGKGPVVAKY